MEARLIDWPRISRLLRGGAAEAQNIVDSVRARYPEAWNIDPDSGPISIGQALEEQLKTGQVSGPAHFGRLALQLLSRALGEGLDIASFDDIRMIDLFAAAVLDGLPEADRLYGRTPPELKEWDPFTWEMGYVTPDEATSMLEQWPEPDFDDPDPEIYAAREQIESWLRSACDTHKTLIVFWE